MNVGGNKNRNQWRRIDEGLDPAHKEMMLDTDMCLAYMSNLELTYCKKATGTGKCKFCAKLYKNKEPIEMKALREECCAWTHERPLFFYGLMKEGQKTEYCGHEIDGRQ